MTSRAVTIIGVPGLSRRRKRGAGLKGNNSDPAELSRALVEQRIVAALGIAPARFQRDVDMWLEEDFGSGDASVWTQNQPARRMKMEIIAKQEFTLCGLNFMAAVFQRTHSASSCRLFSKFNDGDLVRKGDVVLSGEGDAAALLLGERVSLNLCARLSGVASKTRHMKSLIDAAVGKINLRAPTLLETRKTTPGIRLYEKYATRTGGARNHRHSLDTGLMLKENHLRSFGGISKALNQAKSTAAILTRIEVEVSNLSEFKEALENGADVIMLDNFTLEDVREAVQLRQQAKFPVALEVSGNLTEANITEVAHLGIDFLSSGALIHQATWVDLSLQLYPVD